MALIITGVLGSLLDRLGASEREPLSQFRCREILHAAHPSKEAIDKVRRSLGCGDALAFLAQRHIPVNLDSVNPDPGPLEVVVPRHGSVRAQPNLCARYCDLPLPAASIRRLRPALGFGDEAYVAAPPLALRLAAVHGDTPSLMLLALQLCGAYASDPDGYWPTVYEVPPQTSVQELAEGLCAMRAAEREATGQDGQKRSLRGLQLCEYVASHAADRSRSPMESQLFAYLSLPRRSGGFGLEQPEINGQIELDDEQQLVLNASHIEADLLWRRQRVGVEYESDEWHVSDVSPERVRHDKRRVSAAKLSGYDLLPMTSDVVMSQPRLDAFAELLCQRLGKRLRPMSGRSMRAHRELYQRLFKTAHVKPAMRRRRRGL